MKKIFVLGAFDRYNYGDLLFPYVVKYQIEKRRDDVELSYFGLKESDLSRVGGKKTFGLNQLYKQCNSSEDNTIIVAGGEALGSTWTSMFNSYSKFGKWFLIGDHFFRLPRLMNWLSRVILRGKTPFPFTFDKSFFKGVDRVVFSSLGGSHLTAKKQWIVDLSKSFLHDVDFISVRDRVTQKNVKELSIDAHLCPDSAIVMSEIFPLPVLEQKVSPIVADYVREKAKTYVFIQVSESVTKKKVDELLQMLTEIRLHNKFELCLCPIGVAHGHSDHIALQCLTDKLNIEATLFKEVAIWDIMYLIAQSRCYIGTSLHGAITAMSFGLPYIGMEVMKLNSYLESWGVSPLNRIIPISDIPATLEEAIQISTKKFQVSRMQQIQLVEESFHKIANII